MKSLVSAPTDTPVTVRRILFGGLEDLCTELGMPVGARVVCLRRTPNVLLLRTASGRVVALEADWGRFIVVGLGEAAEAERPGAPARQAALI